MITGKFRHEHKYFINKAESKLLASRLGALLQTDENSAENGYQITSLYFDDCKRTSLFEKLSGTEEREKWRIRYYANNRDNLFLELKQKSGQFIKKKRCKINNLEYYALLNADVNFDETNSPPLFKMFFTQLKAQMFKPDVLVRYEREAFCEFTTNTRITIDKNLQTGYNCKDIFKQDTPFLPVLENNLAILEVKFDNYLPSHAQMLLKGVDTRAQSASKYVMCKKYLKLNIWEDQ